MKKVAFFLLCIAILSSCGYREGVMVAEPVAFIAFTGNTTSAIVKIDNNVTFSLGDSKGTTIKSETWEKEKRLDGTHYKIAPGKHLIQVLKNGKIVVDRELMIGDGITLEISVP